MFKFGTVAATDVSDELLQAREAGLRLYSTIAALASKDGAAFMVLSTVDSLTAASGQRAPALSLEELADPSARAVGRVLKIVSDGSGQLTWKPGALGESREGMVSCPDSATQRGAASRGYLPHRRED